MKKRKNRERFKCVHIIKPSMSIRKDKKEIAYKLFQENITKEEVDLDFEEEDNSIFLSFGENSEKERCREIVEDICFENDLGAKVVSETTNSFLIY